ncbi:MAG: cell division protein ZapB [Deltaproteobacteria bacterium]|nr:cell division protein ZapB [Deltaproteobacteria bacterium]
MEIGKFEALEDKIRYLVKDYSLLKTRIQELEELLKNKVEEIEEAKIKIKGFQEERDTVRAKVDSLIDLLQDINVSQ